VPNRPTDEEVRRILAYLNDTAVDPGDFWRSVQSEILTHTFRPVDIKSTFMVGGAGGGAGPATVTNLFATIAVPTPIQAVATGPDIRVLVVRGFTVQDAGNAPPQQVLLHLNRSGVRTRLLRITAPTAGGVVIGQDTSSPETQMAWALLPIVLYGEDARLDVEFTSTPAADMAISTTFIGEEYDFPYRSMGT